MKEENNSKRPSVIALNNQNNLPPHLVRDEEQGNIKELHKDNYQKRVRVSAEQLQSTLESSLDHFSHKYGEKMQFKQAIEYAPKFDFNIQEKENKELRKVYDPLKKELKRQRAANKEALVLYNKLQANVNYTNSVTLSLT